MALDFNPDYDKDFLESLKFIKVKEIYKNLGKSDKNIILKQVDHLLATSMENPEYISSFGYYEKDENIKISLVFFAMKSFIELCYPIRFGITEIPDEQIQKLVGYIRRFNFVFYRHYSFSKEVMEEYRAMFDILQKKAEKDITSRKSREDILKAWKI